MQPNGPKKSQVAKRNGGGVGEEARPNRLPSIPNHQHLLIPKSLLLLPSLRYHGPEQPRHLITPQKRKPFTALLPNHKLSLPKRRRGGDYYLAPQEVPCKTVFRLLNYALNLTL
jgi:hypothetical protein